MKTVTRIIVALLLLSAASIMATFGMRARASTTDITVKGGDYSFEAPEQIPPGLVSFTFENVGKETHHMQIVELKAGVTVDQLMAAFPKGDAALTPLLKGIPGGSGPIAPGGSQRVTVRLEAGQHMLLCFVPDHQGVPHLAQGMAASLVVAGEAPAYQSEPPADETVTLVDFGFVLPEAIKAGKQTWKVVNEGKQPHEIALVKLAAGKTMEDVQAFMQAPHGPPPFVDAGGFQGIDPGKSGWMDLNLEPGAYVAICHIPDAATGKAHSELGMVRPFQVE